MTTPTHSLTGSCVCGSVSFTLNASLTDASACHCAQCRKQGTLGFAGANLPKSAVAIAGAELITWYQSSEKVRRGFCSRCGSWLFWEPIHREWTSVSLGTIDGESGVKIERHIFVAEKGDYYEIADGLPQNPR
jgi:hypothetical protein